MKTIPISTRIVKFCDEKFEGKSVKTETTT